MEAIKSIQHPEALFEHIKRYTDKKQNYNDGNRNNYIHLLAHNCNRRGLPKEQTLYYCVNQFDLPTQEIEETIASAYSDKAEHNKDKSKSEEDEITKIDRIENFLSERYKFRFNVVTGKLEYKIISEENFLPITDYKENSFLRELQKARVKCNITFLRTVLGSDFCKAHNPFTEYFSSLPQWDGVTDYIQQLAATVTTTQQVFWVQCFRKWIVAAVGTAIDEKTINHCVIVFSGKQGIGKTTWTLNLVPPQLKDYCFSGTINPSNKDTLIQLAECFLINLDELENLNRTEIGSLKEIITKNQIRIRKSYGHNNENIPRRASFIGSVNTAQFLNDTTGSRRFLSFEVTDIEYQHKVDLSMVYAQALHLFNSGFKFYFEKKEIDAITANNEQYQLKSAEEELLLTYFEKPADTNGATFFTTTEIANKIAAQTKTNVTNSNIIMLGKALHKHKYFRIKKGDRYVYAVRERGWDEVNRQATEGNQEPPF